jgi:hypothetical protein
VKRNLFERELFFDQRGGTRIEHKISQFRDKNKPDNVKNIEITGA